MPDIRGRFEGEVRTTWLSQVEPDRDMELIEDFVYVDAAGKRWVATASTVVNGASIPELLWSWIVGTPYIGDYRRATVLHDAYYSDPRGETRKAVDVMFREAMILDGVTEARAKAMYAAVRLFGGGAWGDADASLREAPPPAEWAEFETWYAEEGSTLDASEIDQALAERFGPIP